MKPALKKTFSAILIALASLVIVIGIASLALVQGGKLLPGKSNDLTPTQPATGEQTDITSTPLPDVTKSDTTTGTKKSSTPQASSTNAAGMIEACGNTPKEWMPIIVMPGQTLNDIAAQYKTSADALKVGNCLTDAPVQEQTIIFVPLGASQTSQTSAQCGAPAGWVYYYVQPGDTLNSIAAAFGISVNQLMNANCLSTTYIYAGQVLYVPNVPPYSMYPIQPIVVPTQWITIPQLLTPQVPYLPTGIPFPPP